MDSKLIQGLLIGSCILLLFGTIMTVADITNYKGLQAVSAAEPGPSAAAEPAARPQAGLLDLAPAGAMGYVSFDIPKLLASPLLQSLTEGQPMPVDAQKIGQAAVFLLSVSAEEGEWCGVFKTKGTTPEDFAQFLTGTPVTVEGMEAYPMQPPAGPMGGPGAGPQAMIALADDTTVLAGSSQGNLAKAIKAFKGEARGDLSGARQMAAAYARDAVNGAFVVTDEMKAELAADPETPTWMADATGGAFGISVAAGLAVKGMLELGNADAAQQAAAEGTAKINEFKQQMSDPTDIMAMMFQPFKPLIDNMTASADGSAVRMSITLSEAELNAMGEALKQMQQGMMGGGMPGAGPDMAFPPPTGG